MAQSSIGKFVPTVGYTTMLAGRVIDATLKEITKSLKEGKHVGIIPGGAREMTLCSPGEAVISLVPHTGFLRVVWEEFQQGEGSCSSSVVPAFVFGMHDSYWTPFSGIDRALYEATGLNIPLWLPTWDTILGEGTCLVVRKNPLYPRNYPNLDDFVAGYFDVLEELFYEHRSLFPAYKNRELSFVFKPSTTRAHSRRNVDRSKMVTYLKTAFLLLFIWIFLSQDRLTKFSTGESFSSLEIQLIIHISATLTWTLASGNLTIMGFHRYHREIGYTALLSMIVVSGTAVHLVIQNFQTSIMEHLGFVSTFHVIFHSVSNLHIAIIVPVFLGHGLSAARCKDSKTHSNIMSAAHFLVAVNILPRVFAVVLRWTFYLSVDGWGHVVFSCLPYPRYKWVKINQRVSR